MCGIAGVLKIYQPGEPVPPHHGSIPDEWLDTLDESIRHRGPDGQGRFRDRATRPDGTTVDVALVHRRLSIIDHAGGAQPMVHLRHPDGTGELLSSPTPPPSGTGFQPVTPQSPNQRAPRASEGTQPSPGSPHAPPLPDPTPPRSLEGLTPHTIDATTLPQGTDLVAVAFNGCIYNHRDLRTDLEAAGHRFQSDHADTEVLIHGWREHGLHLQDELDGMYAALIWDRAKGQLAWGRDLADEKPLCIHAFELYGLAFFGSSRASVHSLVMTWEQRAGQIRPGIVSAWIQAGWEELSPLGTGSHPRLPWMNLPQVYLRGDESPEELRSLATEQQSRMTRNSGTRYREIPLVRTSTAEASDSVTTFKDAITSAITSRLEADAPLGLFLSGGIDSALIAAIAKQHRPDINAFTVRMPQTTAGPHFDESEAAAETAAHLGLTHHILDCDSSRAAEDLVALIEQLGLPFGDSSLLPTHWVCRAAREHVKVALSGDGGDELFGGYRRHTINPALHRYRHLLRLIPNAILTQRHPGSRTTSLARLATAARHGGYSELLSIFPTPDLRKLIPEINGERPGDDHFTTVDDPLRHDFLHYLPDDLLRKTDTASMAVALEVRCPFLARDLVDTAMRTPLDVLMPNNERKGLLKQIARQYLPDHIINRPKQGFAIPIGEWFRTDFGGLRTLLHDHLLSADPFPGLADAGINIDLNHVRRLLREHDAAGERSLNPWHGRDHSQRLYMLLVLSIWSRWLARLRGSHTASPDRDPTGPTTTLRTSE